MLKAKRMGNTTAINRAEAYKTSRGNLAGALAGAKARAWEDMIRSLNQDPWERPYKTVMNKLWLWAPLPLWRHCNPIR